MKHGIVYILFYVVIMASCGEKTPAVEEIELPLFELLPSSSTGVDFSNIITEDRNKNIINYQGYYDGGGVAVADFNNDGLQDIFFTANLSANKLYINQGHFKFIDQTIKAGLEKNGFGWCNGVTVVDINNDGWMDMYICRSGNFKEENRKNQLFINNGDLTFTDHASFYGLDHAGYSTQAAFFDYDRDGDLDMYLANYGPMTSQFDNEKTLSLRKLSDPFSGDKLFEQVDGKFMDVTSKAGLLDHMFGYAQSVSVADINSDGWDDLYVCNDFFEADYLYINNGDKTFSDKIAESMNHISNSSMGNDIADYNNDGFPDIMVLDMVAEDNRRMKENMGGMDNAAFNTFANMGFHYQYLVNTLQLNNGNGTFSELAHLAGVSNTDWSWAALFADFDNDGNKDLYITNGLKREARNLTAKKTVEKILLKAYNEGGRELTDQEWNTSIQSMPSEKIKNYMFRNKADYSFDNVTDNWGLGFASFSNGAAYADLDNDGDLDLVVNNITDKAFVFKNNISKGNFLNISLKGPQGNINGLGSKVAIFHNGKQQFLRQSFARGFRSSMAGKLHFGLGSHTLVDSLQITWPDGKTQLLLQVKGNQSLEINYIDAIEKQKPNKSNPTGYFTDITDYSKIDSFDFIPVYNDFDHEPMLPYKLSHLGPVLVKGDVNNDGLEDLFIGGNAGYASSIYMQTPDGKFSKTLQPDFLKIKQYQDGGATFLDIDSDGDLDLYISSGGNQAKENDPVYQDRVFYNDGSGKFHYSKNITNEIYVSSSGVAGCDFDQDGDVDILVGGRLVPGRYPASASSYLLENREGQLIDVTEQRAPGLKHVGMVTSVIWIDYDKDGDEDIMLAGEWMPISLFQNENGHFKEITMEAGLGQSAGWWQTLHVADLDNDGDPDVVAGNLGLSSRFKAKESAPFEVFAGDLDNNGSHDVVLAYRQQGKLYPINDYMSMARQTPFIETKFPSYESFARAQVTDIFPQEILNQFIHKTVQTFASSILLNTGAGKFEIKELPNMAQFSAVNSIISSDINGDGNLDLILAGNIYDFSAETVRNDASFGCVLTGDGRGTFDPLPIVKSGFSVGGNVKSGIMIQTPKNKILVYGKNNDRVQVLKTIP